MASRKRSRSCSTTSSLLLSRKRRRSLLDNPVTIGDLSVELIEEIIALLSQHDLTQVARTSRQFHLHAQDALYHRLDISTFRKTSTWKLLNTFLECNYLADTIRSAEIRIGPCAKKHCRPSGVLAADAATGRLRPQLAFERTSRSPIACDANLCGSILGLCSELQRLDVFCRSTSWGHLFTPLLDRTNLRFNGMNHVTHLTLRQDPMVFADRTSLLNTTIWPMLLAFTKLPALRSLSISKVEAIAAVPLVMAPVLHRSFPSKMFSLRSLELRDCVFRPQALNALLTHTPNLTSLRMSIPHHYANQYASHVACLPWDDLPWALGRIKHSLQELEFDAKAVWWHYQASRQRDRDLEPMGSLRDFDALRTVRVSKDAFTGGGKLSLQQAVRMTLPRGVRDAQLLLYGGKEMCLVRQGRRRSSRLLRLIR
jgi:hypothetical protein